ncbi:MAG: hypothetical protein Q6K55_00140, partial [Thermostichus sp. DG02_3_bins_51]
GLRPIDMTGLRPIDMTGLRPQTTEASSSKLGSPPEDNEEKPQDPRYSGIPVIIYIGSENPLESLHHCTVIASTYHRRSSPLGTVTLLGPTRMAYERSIAAVQAVASHLSRALA